MPTDDLGEYDVEPVEGNPFGAMAASPDDYDVAPVDHDPFAAPPDEFRLASRQPERPSGIGSDARYPVAPPLGWNPPPLSSSDRDLLIKTVYGEARGEPEAGQEGVTHAILNRVRSGGYGPSIRDVIMEPAAGVNPARGFHEFSPWNPKGVPEGQPWINTLQRDRPEDYARISRLVDRVYSGTSGDPTYGATHYYGRMRGHPSWSPPLAAQNQVKLGNTTFVGGETGPGYHEPMVATRFAGGRIGYQDGGVTDLGSYDPSSIADKYITRSGELVPQAGDPLSPTATSMLADKYTSGSQISDPEWMNWQEENAQAEQRNAEWGAATETFHPQTMNFVSRTGGTIPAARATIQKMYPGGPDAETPDVMQRAYSDLVTNRRSFSSSPVSQGGRGQLGTIGVFGSTPLMAPRMVGHPGYQLRDPFEERFQAQAPPEEGESYAAYPASEWRGGRIGRAEGGVTDLGYDDQFASNANPDYVGSEGESGGSGQGSATLYTLGRSGTGGGETGVLGAPREAPSTASASDPIAAEQARAAEAAGRYSPVDGLPQKPIQFKDGSFYVPGPIASVHDAAEAYMRDAGLQYDPPTDYAKLDKGRSGRIAQAFDDMAHDPHDPAVRAAYEALARETMAQYQYVKGTGLKIDYITPEMADPYADNPREAIKDIRDNNHWWVYPTESGYGAEGAAAAEENPMLRPSGETISGRPTVINDIFRVVHDYFGHAKEGHGFRAEGEENAWRSHMAMYSPQAVPAATTELRGQNSWLNYGPYGETNRTAKAADTVFAEQKLGLMPEWTWKEGGSSGAQPMRPLMAPTLVGRPATSLVGAEEHLLREREGLEQPGQSRPVEWTGGRIRTAYAFGGNVADQNDELRQRISFLQRPRFQGGGDVNDPHSPAAGFAALDKMSADYRTAHPEEYQPPPQPAAPQAPQTWYGRWGQTLGDELSAGASGAASALDYAGGKAADFAASVAANPVGYGPLSFRTMSPEHEQYVANAIKGAGGELLSDPMLGGEFLGAPRAAEEATARTAAAGSDVSAAAAPARAQVLDINGVKRHIDPDFPESRVGTSVPWNEDPDAPIEAAQGAHANNDAHVGMDLVGQAGSRYGKAVADMVRNGKIPFVRVPPGATDAQIHEALISHMTDNLSGLYNRVKDAVKNGSKLWYEGANSRTRNIAVTHDIPHENAAGVVASLSPQKDWDQNVTLGDWVAHTAGTTKPDATMTPEMTDWANRYAMRKDPERIETDPETGKEIRYNARTGEVMSPNSVSRQDVLTQLNEVAGKPWAQMTPEQKAFYTRSYYEAHGPPDHLMPYDDRTGEPLHWTVDRGNGDIDHKYGYYINNPDGTHNGVVARYGDEKPNVKDQPIPVSWGSTGEVANAIKAFGAQSMSDISEALGGGHKVRSFFNNIIAPWSRKGDVTSDTHAVAAALLRPLGAGSPEAASGMGAASPTHNETGINGFYPFVAEAYRRAAKAAGILPREMQSITWEALRGRWLPQEKSAKTNLKKNFTSQTDITNGIWQAYKNNPNMTMDQVHDAILGPNGERIRDPRWFGTFRPGQSP